jgi:hypothetical protein
VNAKISEEGSGGVCFVKRNDGGIVCLKGAMGIFPEVFTTQLALKMNIRLLHSFIFLRNLLSLSLVSLDFESLREGWRNSGSFNCTFARQEFTTIEGSFLGC